MKISCPSCSAKYSISDEKVVSRLAKIRCRKCGATIVIDGKMNPPTVTATAGGGGDAGEDHAVQEQTDTGGPEYSVDLGEGDQRTMPLPDIIAAYNAGQITGETFVWADGFSDWKALSEVQEIVDALHAAAGGAKPASSPVAASPWDAKPAAPQPSPVRAAARPARAAASDLFGRIDRAGSEEDVATSAPDPMGLGGGGGSSGGTGARNESSVLFSLSALTSASAPNNKSVPSPSRASSGSSTTASRDDSGLIDLKALTAAAVKSDGGAQAALASPALSPLAASPLGVAAPLGLGSPLGGGLMSSDLGAPQKSKTGLFIAIAIVAAAVIVAVALILRPAPPPPVVAAPPPPPPPAAAPAPTPTPTLAAAPPPTGSAETEAATAKKAPSTTYRRTGSVTKKPTGATTTAGGASEPAAAPAKPRSKCGCASGDLQCAMRCAAKGG